MKIEEIKELANKLPEDKWIYLYCKDVRDYNELTKKLAKKLANKLIGNKWFDEYCKNFENYPASVHEYAENNK